MNTIETAIDNLNFIIANPFDVHLVEQKAKETLELLDAGASAMNGSAGAPAIDMDKAANLIINRLDDLGREYSDEYGLPTQNENKGEEMKQIVIKAIHDSVSSPSPLEAETADKEFIRGYSDAAQRAAPIMDRKDDRILELEAEVLKLRSCIKRMKDDLKPDPWDDLGKQGNTGY